MQWGFQIASSFEENILEICVIRLSKHCAGIFDAHGLCTFSIRQWNLPTTSDTAWFYLTKVALIQRLSYHNQSNDINCDRLYVRNKHHWDVIAESIPWLSHYQPERYRELHSVFPCVTLSRKKGHYHSHSQNIAKAYGVGALTDCRIVMDQNRKPDLCIVLTCVQARHKAASAPLESSFLLCSALQFDYWMMPNALESGHLWLFPLELESGCCSLAGIKY